MTENSHGKLAKMTYEIITTAEKNGNPDSVINACIECIGHSLSADRCYIFEQTEDVVNNTYEWVAEGVKPEKENLQNLPVSGITGWYKYFEEDKIVTIEDIEDIREVDPWVYETLKMQDIKSVIVGPLKENGQVIGFYGVDNPPADMMKDIRKMMEVLSYLVISAIRRRELEKLTYKDYLTGAWNRRAFYNHMKEYNLDDSIGILYCDAVGLKQANDTKGHLFGDTLLKDICKCIREVFDEFKTYRLGGDEFIVVCPNVDREFVRTKSIELEKLVVSKNINLSIGIAYREELADLKEIDHIFNDAENEMYKAKELFYDLNKEKRR